MEYKIRKKSNCFFIIFLSPSCGKFRKISTISLSWKSTKNSVSVHFKILLQLFNIFWTPLLKYMFTTKNLHSLTQNITTINQWSKYN